MERDACVGEEDVRAEGGEVPEGLETFAASTAASSALGKDPGGEGGSIDREPDCVKGVGCWVYVLVSIKRSGVREQFSRCVLWQLYQMGIEGRRGAISLVLGDGVQDAT